MATRRRRNIVEARTEILDAVSRTLKKRGFINLNLNTVGEEVEMDKTSIYRYFGDFDTLLKEYVNLQDYWLHSLRDYSDIVIDNKREFTKAVIREQFELLTNNEEFKQLLIWELADKDGVAMHLTVKREMYARKILEQSRYILEKQGIDFNFIMALIFGGFYYLTLHGEYAVFCSVDLNKKEHRQELLRTMDWLVDVLFDISEQKTNRIEQVVIKAYRQGINIETIAEITDLPIKTVENLIS